MDEAMSGTSYEPTSLTSQQTIISHHPAFNHNNGININDVIELVKTLYNSSNPDEQNEASCRLTEIQSSPSAWEVCWLLLDPNQNHPNEVHFFAANMLSLKINQSWSHQDAEWLEKQLRPKLFETLVKYAASPNGTKLVIDRLTLALANFALHSIPTFWLNAIEEIVQTLTSSNLSDNIPHQRICDILLKILTYIPEEYSLMIPNQNDRSTLNGQITKSGPIVFKFLHTLLMNDKSATTPECRQEILKCLTSWVTHSGTTLFELEDGKSLLNLIYDFIMDDELCGAACAALAATFDSRKSENYINSIIEFMPKLANLKPVIDKYITREEVECVIKIYSLVIQFCDNHSKLMVKIVLGDNIQLNDAVKETTKQAVLTLIRLILDCTAAPGIFGMDEKYSEITFQFWFTFFEVFYYYLDSYTDVICDLFDPLVDSLVQILVKKAQYPPAVIYHQAWNDDQREEYRRYRHDLGDVISLIVQFPRAKGRIIEQFYEQLAQELHHFVQMAQSPKQAATANDEPPWQGLEAAIFGLKCIAESIPYDEEKYMPKIFELLAQVPFSECLAAELYCTATEMIAAYADWLFTHTNHLSVAYKILFLGVTAPHSYVRLMSTISLKDITSECQTVLHPFAKDIVKSCQDAILQHGQLLETPEKARLMHTFGCAVVMTPPTMIAESIAALTTPLLCDLGTKVQLDLDSNPTCRSAINDLLQMLNSLIESLHVKQYSGNGYEDADENNFSIYSQILEPSPDLNMEAAIGQPAVGLLKQLIPILNVLVEKYRSDEEIMCRVGDTVKKSARNLSIELKPVLKDLIGILDNAYDPLLNFTIIQDSVPLYNIFKVDPSTHTFLRDAFASITEKTLSYCLANPLRQLSVTVEAYFKYAHLVCKKFSNFLTEQPCHVNVDLIYKLALASLELPEKRTLAEVCNFLTLFRMKSLGVPHLHAIFVNHLDMLLINIFYIFGGNYSTPRNAIEAVSDLFFFVLDAQESRGPLNRIVERGDFPTSHVTQDQKARFISTLLQEAKRKNRRKFKDACTDFVLVARNLNRAM